MTKLELRKLAYREAAARLACDADSMDLDDRLSEADEEFVREYIRNEIVDRLAKKGAQ